MSRGLNAPYSLSLMSVICKRCDKDLYKSDGSGPYACPSCVYDSLETIDPESGATLPVLPLVGNTKAQVALALYKDTRFAQQLPSRPESYNMLRLQSKQHRDTTIPINGVLVRFDRDGVALVAEHNKQFIDIVNRLRPGRLVWLEDEQADLAAAVEVLEEVISPKVPKVKPAPKPAKKKAKKG